MTRWCSEVVSLYMLMQTSGNIKSNREKLAWEAHLGLVKRVHPDHGNLEGSHFSFQSLTWWEFHLRSSWWPSFWEMQWAPISSLKRVQNELNTQVYVRARVCNSYVTACILLGYGAILHTFSGMEGCVRSCLEGVFSSCRRGSSSEWGLGWDILLSLADITVICPWEAFSHLELHELAQFGIIWRVQRLSFSQEHLLWMFLHLESQYLEGISLTYMVITHELLCVFFLAGQFSFKG